MRSVPVRHRRVSDVTLCSRRCWHVRAHLGLVDGAARPGATQEGACVGLKSWSLR